MKEIDVRNVNEYSRMWSLSHIHTQDAWLYAQGKGVKVAVLDSGVSHKHPDLQGRILDSEDFTRSRNGAEDMNGHGTHVAGIISANKDDKGIVGIAPDSELLIAKVLKDNGRGHQDSVKAGMEWAIEKGADIIVMSLGTEGESSYELYEQIRSAYVKDIILIAAAGNQSKAVAYPAAYEEVIAVSATERNDRRARYSNYGSQIEISAPGTEVLSTYKNEGYAILSGTSMATPLVAGAVALYISYFKETYKKRPCIKNVRRFLSHAVSETENNGKEGYGHGILSLKNFIKKAESTSFNC